MSEVRTPPKRRRWLILIAMATVVVAVAGLLAYSLWPSSDSVVSAQGGEAWNADRTVAVQVLPGGATQNTRITFKKPDTTPKEAPIMTALEVIVPAVDIVPDHPLNVATAAEQEAAAYAEGSKPASKVRVKFKVPGNVPLSATGKDGKPRRSIYNAGIEVFNTHLQTWIPLETAVEGDTLVADAPHFSEFRAVWERTGEVVINAGKSIKTTLNAATAHPIDLIGHTIGEYLRSFANNYAGIFDDRKMEACTRSRAGSIRLM